MKIDNKSYRITDAGSLGKKFLIIGIIGLALSAIGLFTDSRQFYFSYLTAFIFWLTIGLGALFLVMMHHLTNSTWSIILRRIMENIMIAVPFAAIFFIPILFGIKDLYQWSHPDIVAGNHLLQAKAGYLGTGFFIIRTIFYFGVWSYLSTALFKVSIKQDKGYDDSQIRKMRLISAPGMVIFALTLTFASFDWIMSLDAQWYSTIFGVYIFSGAALAVLAFIILQVIYLQNNNIMKNEITVEHYHDLGKLTFTFVIFWAYIAFSQYFLIWYGNIPEETIWYHQRWDNSFKYVSLALVFGNFVIPFVVMIARGGKRNLTTLRIMAIWLLFMHWVDIYWLIMPNFKQNGFLISWMDFTTMLGTGGIFLWFFWWKMKSNPIVPVNDPRLDESIKIIS